MENELKLEKEPNEYVFYVGVNYYSGRKPYISTTVEEKKFITDADAIYKIVVPAKPNASSDEGAAPTTT